ncbi:hypothetical protein A0H81_09406 [Grifola frondosa]|uniref:Uncharacterized protein n=1 Tax=Grifola frondosa TaxID=5627 RepID=A0A1C7M276_GRIFR|nr:hypothetical protein A0H81_09406 [Grifola frondosa]
MVVSWNSSIDGDDPYFMAFVPVGRFDISCAWSPNAEGSAASAPCAARRALTILQSDAGSTCDLPIYGKGIIDLGITDRPCSKFRSRKQVRRSQWHVPQRYTYSEGGRSSRWKPCNLRYCQVVKSRCDASWLGLQSCDKPIYRSNDKWV